MITTVRSPHVKVTNLKKLLDKKVCHFHQVKQNQSFCWKLKPPKGNKELNRRILSISEKRASKNVHNDGDEDCLRKRNKTPNEDKKITIIKVF